MTPHANTSPQGKRLLMPGHKTTGMIESLKKSRFSSEKCSLLKFLVNLHAVNCRAIPQRSFVDLIGDGLNVINEHAAERSFDAHNNKSDADLKDSSDQATDIRQQNG